MAAHTGLPLWLLLMYDTAFKCSSCCACLQEHELEASGNGESEESHSQAEAVEPESPHQALSECQDAQDDAISSRDTANPDETASQTDAQEDATSSSDSADANETASQTDAQDDAISSSDTADPNETDSQAHAQDDATSSSDSADACETNSRADEQPVQVCANGFARGRTWQTIWLSVMSTDCSHHSHISPNVFFTLHNI